MSKVIEQYNDENGASGGTLNSLVKCSGSNKCTGRKWKCRHIEPHSHGGGCDYGECRNVRGLDKHICCVEIEST